MKKPHYSIGVVTYHARFETYFKPLIENLARIFPDREILCVVNGHPEQTLQIRFLDEVTSFMKRFPNVRYLAHAAMQPLSKSWNQLIALSHTEKIVIMGDDIFVGDFFRESLEKVIADHPMFLINRTWCHFVISKETVRKVGWFEERYPGIGWEDTDYTFRMNMAGLPIPSEKVLGILNLSTDNDNNPGWENPADRQMKYTSANEDFFLKKWRVELYHGKDQNYEHDSKGPYGRFALNSEMETPLFYELSVLDNGEKTVEAGYEKDLLRYWTQKIVFVTMDAILTSLRKIKRFAKKAREALPPI